jgi:hypothetical protein
MIYPSSKQKYYQPEDYVEVKLSLNIKKNIEDPIMGVTVKDIAGREIFVTNTKALDVKTGSLSAGDRIEITFTMQNVFNDGTYTVTPAIAEKDVGFFYDVIEDACRFKVLGWPFPTGIAQTPTTVKLTKTGQGSHKKK